MQPIENQNNESNLRDMGKSRSSSLIDEESGIGQAVEYQLNTLNDVSRMLSFIQQDSTPSVQAIIFAQLQLIKLIQIPTVVGSSIDTLLLYLKISLDKAQSDDERSNIRTHFALIVQNLKLFIDVKMKYDAGRKNAELLSAACTMFENCVENIVRLSKNAICICASVGCSAIQMSTIGRQAEMGDSSAIKKVFSITDNLKRDIQKSISYKQDQSSPKNGLVRSFFRWIASMDEICEMENNYYVTMAFICKRLLENKKLIGPSIIIYGTMDSILSQWSQRIESVYEENKPIFASTALASIVLYLTICIVASILFITFKWGSYWWILAAIIVIGAALILILFHDSIKNYFIKVRALSAINRLRRSSYYFRKNK